MYLAFKSLEKFSLMKLYGLRQKTKLKIIQVISYTNNYTCYFKVNIKINKIGF